MLTEHEEFESSRQFKLRRVGVPVALLVFALAAGSVILARQGEIWVAVVGSAPWALFGLLQLILSISFVGKVRIDHQSVEFTNMFGRETSLLWTEITRVECALAKTLEGQVKMVRIFGRGVSRGLLVTDELVRFDHFLRILTDRATNAQSSHRVGRIDSVLFGARRSKLSD